jgi:PAS domain S-box-containing protein
LSAASSDRLRTTESFRTVQKLGPGRYIRQVGVRVIPLIYKGSWVEDIAEPVRPDSFRLDFTRARTGFIRSILIAYFVGLAVTLVVSIVLAAIGRTDWWRLLLNIVGYNVVAAVLGLVIYRQANKTWLQAVGSGRALTIADISSDAVYSAGNDTIITTWSRGAERVLGWTAEEIIGLSCATILPDDFIEREAPMLQTLFQDGIVTSFKTFNVRKNGEVFPTEASITLLREPDGTPGGFLAVVRDRSRHVQIEEELRRIRDEMETRALTESEASVDGPTRGDGEQVRKDALRDAAEATVSALAAVAERRDPYTAGHQQRVSQLASAIAREMGLADDQVEGVRIAGILHDTGKVVIPGEILSKPSNLSEFEFGIIKTHPRVDSEIVEGINFPWPVARTVLQHHERLDGSGYPSGLKGDEILLEARILAVADVVEAMASHRPYRPARGIDEALGEVTAGKGTRYDPQVVDACLTLFTEGGFELKQ